MQPLNLTRSVFFSTVLDQDLRQVSFFISGARGTQALICRGQVCMSQTKTFVMK